MKGNEKMKENEKTIKRLLRDKNFLEMEKKRLIKELETERAKNDFLIKREVILQKVESYLLGRTKVLRDLKRNEFEFAVLELEKLSDALEEERKLLYNEVEEDEGEINERTCNEVERDSKRTRYITNRI